MRRYNMIRYQTIRNGKISSTGTTTVNANSMLEARNRFNMSHTPTDSCKYKIIACVKR